MKRSNEKRLVKILVSFCLMAVLLFSGVGSSFAGTPNPPAFHPYAFLAKTPEYYAKYHILPGIVLPYEDGMRTTSASGSYEWWYFDAALSDGSIIAIVFYDKNPETPYVNYPVFEPFVSFYLLQSNGTIIAGNAPYSANQFSASKLYCNVQIGPNTFKGNLHDYTINLVNLPCETLVNGQPTGQVNVTANISLAGTVPAWRPDTGHVVFQDYNNVQHYFAWLPAVPQGDVSCKMNIGAQSYALTGIGYHDHNWGDCDMSSLMDHWYWGRCTIGNYSAITSDITASSYYNSSAIPIFMLANNGNIIADDGSKVIFAANNPPPAFATNLSYNYDNGKYEILYTNPQVILQEQFDSGNYYHFLGAATLLNNGTPIGSNYTSWEFMDLQ